MNYHEELLQDMISAQEEAAEHQAHNPGMYCDTPRGAAVAFLHSRCECAGEKFNEELFGAVLAKFDKWEKKQCL